jgi:hypothetical protein
VKVQDAKPQEIAARRVGEARACASGEWGAAARRSASPGGVGLQRLHTDARSEAPI